MQPENLHSNKFQVMLQLLALHLGNENYEERQLARCTAYVF